MRYLPTSDPIRQRMLADLGLNSIDELFSHIPEYCRLQRPLNIPKGQAEADIIRFFRAAAAENAPGFTSFVGAGAYHHFRPTHVDTLISRGEWFTAYTPYQPEISQGTLQSIFEFQTMICQLTGQDVANAGMYDGSTALHEACMMAARVTGRSGMVVARSIHPQYRQVLRTLTRYRDFPTTEVGFGTDGRIDVAALRAAVNSGTAAVAVQSPNFFGNLEDWEQAAEIAHGAGALLIAVITDPVSLGLLPPPEAADIVAMELQGFGIPVGFGGPYAGIIASRDKFVRSLPGRLVGEARDSEGRRGFVLTLSTREQHIRREKATSNICTNQALCALMASIFMATYGKQGLRELAEQNLAKAAYAASAFTAAGAEVLFPSPRFHEFVVRLKRPLAASKSALKKAKLIAGLPLNEHYPELGEALLVCVTEIITREDIDRLVAAL
ncbi:MAG TPA: aminomethyl-transferring glycine dehydrogenase subunit GcvPA [Terriglobales bacterium]|jgi:glycine dehydrogenase subunit 1